MQLRHPVLQEIFNFHNSWIASFQELTILLYWKEVLWVSVDSALHEVGLCLSRLASPSWTCNEDLLNLKRLVSESNFFSSGSLTKLMTPGDLLGTCDPRFYFCAPELHGLVGNI